MSDIFNYKCAPHEIKRNNRVVRKKLTRGLKFPSFAIANVFLSVRVCGKMEHAVADVMFDSNTFVSLKSLMTHSITCGLDGRITTL